MNSLKWGWERGKDGETSEEVPAVRDDSGSAPAVAVGQQSNPIWTGEGLDGQWAGRGEK